MGHTWKGSCQGWPSRDIHFRVLLLLTRYIGKVDSRGPGGGLPTKGHRCWLVGVKLTGVAVRGQGSDKVAVSPWTSSLSSPRLRQLFLWPSMFYFYLYIFFQGSKLLEGSHLCCGQISLCSFCLLVLGLPSVATRPPLFLLPSRKLPTAII